MGTTGTLYVGVGGTLRLTDNPVQLQNGNLNGGNWNVDDTGVLIIPSDISQITTQPGAAYWTVLDVQGSGSLQDTSGNSPLATLTSVGSDTVLSLPSVTVDHDPSDDVGPSLNATSVIVESGATLATTGTVVSSITNNGTVSPGIVTVTGNYTQAAGATLSELFGYATLNVKQSATVSGALNVTFSPKHPPQSGAKYTALTFGSLSGSFTSHTAGFTLTTSGNSIQVTKQ